MLKNSTRFRRVATGTLLILAPLLQLVAVIVDPGTWGDDREAVSYGDNPALAQLQSVLYHWSWLLMAVAAFGLLHFVRRRVVAFGHITGVMAILGYINASALLMTDPPEWWLGQHYPPEEAERIMNEMMDLPHLTFGFVLPGMVGLVSLPLLLTAVWRAKAVHWWVPLTVAVGYLASFPVPYGPLTIAFWGLPVVALGAFGLKVLRMGDDAWAAYYPAAAPGVTTPDSYAKTTA
ncbi:hypothetical protein [Microtetraspora sp. NBRC 16547]|uniref:hypothetical protein n=1 Tax=Microtetraspora sp. NBRC 16547 TaxID=3030993 RepID=UPI0024A44AA3|nr:hypothetical protein [Microtetraspora sp. NBRC 16547]GLW97060.1 hypothetical protein Misp02_11470 [Microtetraspora sp. NBRC 16547]